MASSSRYGTYVTSGFGYAIGLLSSVIIGLCAAAYDFVREWPSIAFRWLGADPALIQAVDRYLRRPIGKATAMIRSGLSFIMGGQMIGSGGLPVLEPPHAAAFARKMD